MDKARAKQILDRIDEILCWEQRVDQRKDQRRTWQVPVRGPQPALLAAGIRQF
jgi:hypothetical protein